MRHPHCGESSIGVKGTWRRGVKEVRVFERVMQSRQRGINELIMGGCWDRMCKLWHERK